MELNEISFLKILHSAVEKFIVCIKGYFPHEILSKDKLFCEIVKRYELVTQNIRSIVIHIKTSLESSVLRPIDVEVALNDEIEKLVHDLLYQDFLELALNGNEIVSISDDELHNFLYSATFRDITNFTPSSRHVDGSFNFFTPLSSFTDNDIQSSLTASSFSGGYLSTQFEKERIQFDDEFSELRRIAERGFSVSDLNTFNVATIGKYENDDSASKITAQQNEFRPLPQPVIQNNFLYRSISTTESDAGILSDFSESTDEFLSWEGCLGRFLIDHSYISEVTPEEAINNISEKESQTYYSILNSSEAISGANMVHDILDLLIGIPSRTFFYDIHARKFVMKADQHLQNLSSECTAKFVAKFLESGSMYYALQTFSRDFLHACEGLVFRGMQHGIQQILSMYKEYIVAVKVNCPSMLFLRSDVLKNAELLLSFGVICGIDPEKMIINEIPKGLGLLSYLHDIARSHKRKENGIMIAVLLKFAYAPYFRFLNEWMTEGICNDPYGEFQIMEDHNYLERRDALYWKFAYTENIDDPTRVVPPEIKKFSQGILDCGKSIGLLKICCPALPSLKFFFLQPPPSLSMIYSFPASIEKLKNCMDYIVLKEKADLIPKSEISDKSVDSLYIDSQQSVDKTVMMRLVQRRQNILLASMVSKSNIQDFKKVQQYLREYKESIQSPKLPEKCDCSPISLTENKNILRGKQFRCVGPLFSSCLLQCMSQNVFEISFFKPLCLDFGKTEYSDFNGRLFENTGLLFSSCGFVEMDTTENLSKDIEDSFSTLDFSRQLQLLSFTKESFRSLKGKCEKLLSPEIEILNAFCNGSEILNRSVSYKIKCDPKYSLNKEKTECQKPGELPKSKSMETVDDLEVPSGQSESKTVFNSFMDKLVSLLISEYGDSIEDVYSCIQVTSLQRLMTHNFNAVLKMRIYLIEKVIMKYIVKELGLDSLLSCLRNVYFLQDETFSQSLCEQLFSLVIKCRTPGQFANWSVLNDILTNAVSNSHHNSNPFLSSVKANVAFLPEEMPVERTEFLHLFTIEFDVEWPLNIIVHQTCIEQYLKIFSILLEIEFLCWLLGRTWRYLIMTSKDLRLDDTPQFRDIMLKRFDMDQFVRIIRISIHQHFQGPLKEFLDKNLSTEESGIDALENIHMQYLEKALARCFLTDETHVLHTLLSTMLRQIYKFCSAVFESEWTKSTQSGQYETYTFRGLAAAFDTFKEYQKTFTKCIMKESLTKKCGRFWDKDYQNFLETIVSVK